MIKTPLDLITWAGAIALTIVLAFIVVAIAVEVIKQARGLSKPKPIELITDSFERKDPGPTSVGLKSAPLDAAKAQGRALRDRR